LNDIFTVNITDIIKIPDSIINEKPKFIKSTSDYIFLSNLDVLHNLLEQYKFTAEKYIEPDGSVTLSLLEIDLVENGNTESEAIYNMAAGILEYAEDYYNRFDDWYYSTNRKSHFPYVVKALLLSDADKIGRLITCRPGEI